MANFERLLAFNETFLYESVYKSQFNGIISIKFRLELLSLTTVKSILLPIVRAYLGHFPNVIFRVTFGGKDRRGHDVVAQGPGTSKPYWTDL